MKTTVAILGCGSMGTAILAGMLHKDIEASDVKVTVRRAESAEALAKK